MISEYMDSAAMAFWSYQSVNVIQAVVEWLCLLWYLSLPIFSKKEAGLRGFFRKSSLLLPLFHALFLGLSIYLHLQNYKLIIYFPRYMVLCTALLFAISPDSPVRAVFRICPFGLAMELSRLLCRDGILTFLLMQNLPWLNTFASISLCILCYLTFLILQVWWLRHLTRHFEHLHLTFVQLLSFLFPLALYVAVRHFVFYYMDELTLVLWLRLEGLQVAIVACAEYAVLSAGRMAASELEKNELLQREILSQKRLSQYELQTRSIEAVNRRYHDLKHYLSAMEALLEDSSGETHSKELPLLAELRRELASYESMQQTGNRTLDILLAERMEECQKRTSASCPT